jgi:hypothetical protein
MKSLKLLRSIFNTGKSKQIFLLENDKIAEQWLQIVYRSSTNLANENL